MEDNIRRTPNMSNEAMRLLLAPYAPERFLTDAVLQNTRTRAKADVFGNANVNVLYAPGLVQSVQQQGHRIKLLWFTRDQLLRQITKVLVEEENRRRKSENKNNMTGVERQAYLTKWMMENKGKIDAQMGMEQGNKYLQAIMFATAASQGTVPHLSK